MATYTLSEIRTIVNDATRDTDTGLVLAAVKNRLINKRVNEFVEQTGCNRNTLFFSLASGTANGVKIYSKDATTPTVTYNGDSGWPYYTISNCMRIVKLYRWKGIADSVDGVWQEMSPADDNQIDVEGLSIGTSLYPNRFQMMTDDTFRILPQIDSSAYTIKFKVEYEQTPTAMATDGANPSIPAKYQEYVIPGCIAEVFKYRGDERWQVYEAEYQNNVRYVEGRVDKHSAGRKPKLSRRYVGAGG